MNTDSKIIIIPAYEPSEILIKLSTKLVEQGFNLIIVNDGSGAGCQHIFAELSKYQKITIINHAVNLGKGQALKTAFNYYLTDPKSHDKTIITADADGQHLVEDIIGLSRKVDINPFDLWLGVRNFKGKVPFRSAFGNSLTKFIFKLLIGIKLSDTQTGLRGIPRELAKNMLRTMAMGYEFELEMLIKAKEKKIKIREFPIHTVYENNNASSHFNPLIDSIKIYFVFIRFCLISILTAIIDLIVFAIAQVIYNNILISAISSRIIAGGFNFTFGKYYVFKSSNQLALEFAKYSITVLLLALLSFELIYFLINNFGLNVYISKILAETTLFILSFAIQRTFVFGGKN